MKLVNTEYPEAGVCRLTLSATAEELEAGVQAVYERTRGNYTIKGFEKGQADRAQIEAERGEHEFWYDAVNDIMDRDVPAILDQVIAGEELKVEGEPSYDLVSVKKDEGFVATALLALPPELTLTQYTGFTAKCTPAETTDKEVDAAVERQRAGKAELVPHKGPAVKGNTVHVNYTGLLDGKPFAAGKAENKAIELGRGLTPFAGLEEGIIGHQAGEKFEVSARFAANYPQRLLAGKPVVFQVEILDVCLRQLPALNAELAKRLDPGCETMDDYRALVRKRLEERKHAVAYSRARTNLLNQLAAHAEGVISSVLIDREYASRLQNFQGMLQMQRISMEAYLKQVHQTREEFTQRMRQGAENAVRVTYALRKVAELENLLPTDVDLDAEIAARAEKVKKPVEEYAAKVDREELRSTLTRQRATNFVLEHSTIEEA